MRNNGTMENLRKIEQKFAANGSSKIGPFLLGAVVGAVVGGALALIYAPAEGSELRKKITETFDDIAEGVGGMIQTAKSTSDKLFKEGKNIVGDAGTKADEIIDRTREKVDDILDDADRAIAQARKRSDNHSRDEDA